jgi:hypothetical protein
MSQLDDLLERIRAAAGAEFVFVLTRQGKLVTPHAPRDMPEAGRIRLIRAADAVARTGAITSLSLPRGEIVPYGGPGPIDITLAVAAARAVVCLAMTALASRPRAITRLKEGIGPVEALLLRAVASRTKGKKWAETDAQGRAAARPEPAEGIGKRRAGVSKAKRGAEAPGAAIAEQGPEIVVERARKVGRETLAAIEADLAESGLPPVHISEAQLADAGPDIVVERARKIGRETMNAIEAEIAASGAPVPAPRIPPAVLRQTLPWIETPPDSDLAARTSRKNAAPKLSLKLEEADDELLNVALSAEVERIMDNPGGKPPPRLPRSDVRKGAAGEVKGPPRRA